MPENYVSFGLIPTEKLDQLFNEISLLREELKADKIKNSKKLSENWLDSQEVMELLKVSPRTLQNMRDTRTLAYSKVGAKIFYKSKVVENLLMDNYHE